MSSFYSVTVMDNTDEEENNGASNVDNKEIPKVTLFTFFKKIQRTEENRKRHTQKDTASNEPQSLNSNTTTIEGRKEDGAFDEFAVHEYDNSRTDKKHYVNDDQGKKGIYSSCADSSHGKSQYGESSLLIKPVDNEISYETDTTKNVVSKTLFSQKDCYTNSACPKSVITTSTEETESLLPEGSKEYVSEDEDCTSTSLSRNESSPGKNLLSNHTETSLNTKEQYVTAQGLPCEVSNECNYENSIELVSKEVGECIIDMNGSKPKDKDTLKVIFNEGLNTLQAVDPNIDSPCPDTKSVKILSSNQNDTLLPEPERNCIEKLKEGGNDLMKSKDILRTLIKNDSALDTNSISCTTNSLEKVHGYSNVEIETRDSLKECDMNKKMCLPIKCKENSSKMKPTGSELGMATIGIVPKDLEKQDIEENTELEPVLNKETKSFLSRFSRETSSKQVDVVIPNEPSPFANVSHLTQLTTEEKVWLSSLQNLRLKIKDSTVLPPRINSQKSEMQEFLRLSPDIRTNGMTKYKGLTTLNAISKDFGSGEYEFLLALHNKYKTSCQKVIQECLDKQRQALNIIQETWKKQTFASSSSTLLESEVGKTNLKKKAASKERHLPSQVKVNDMFVKGRRMKPKKAKGCKISPEVTAGKEDEIGKSNQGEMTQRQQNKKEKKLKGGSKTEICDSASNGLVKYFNSKVKSKKACNNKAMKETDIDNQERRFSRRQNSKVSYKEEETHSDSSEEFSSSVRNVNRKRKPRKTRVKGDDMLLKGDGNSNSSLSSDTKVITVDSSDSTDSQSRTKQKAKRTRKCINEGDTAQLNTKKSPGTDIRSHFKLPSPIDAPKNHTQERVAEPCSNLRGGKRKKRERSRYSDPSVDYQSVSKRLKPGETAEAELQTHNSESANDLQLAFCKRSRCAREKETSHNEKVRTGLQNDSTETAVTYEKPKVSKAGDIRNLFSSVSTEKERKVNSVVETEVTELNAQTKERGTKNKTTDSLSDPIVKSIEFKEKKEEELTTETKECKENALCAEKLANMDEEPVLRTKEKMQNVTSAQVKLDSIKGETLGEIGVADSNHPNVHHTQGRELNNPAQLDVKKESADGSTVEKSGVEPVDSPIMKRRKKRLSETQDDSLREPMTTRRRSLRLQNKEITQPSLPENNQPDTEESNSTPTRERKKKRGKISSIEPNSQTSDHMKGDLMNSAPEGTDIYIDRKDTLVKEKTPLVEAARKLTVEPPPMNSETVNASMTWTEKYAPLASAMIVGHRDNTEQLFSWLSQWKERHEKCVRKLAQSKVSRSKKHPEDSDFDSDSEDEDTCTNTMVLIGPVGCGTTTMVYGCAHELGYKVLELNPSTCRSGKAVMTQLGEATQSHQVRRKLTNEHSRAAAEDFSTGSRIGNFFSATNSSEGTPDVKKEIKDTTKELSTEMKTDKSSRKDMSLILFEQADVVFEEQDKGFWQAVNDLRSVAKRPILFTANEFRVVQNMPGNEVERLYFSRPSFEDSFAHVQAICMAEKVYISRDSIKRLLKMCGFDFREVILQLEFWTEQWKFSSDEKENLLQKDNTYAEPSLSQDTSTKTDADCIAEPKMIKSVALAETSSTRNDSSALHSQTEESNTTVALTSVKQEVPDHIEPLDQAALGSTSETGNCVSNNEEYYAAVEFDHEVGLANISDIMDPQKVDAERLANCLALSSTSYYSILKKCRKISSENDTFCVKTTLMAELRSEVDQFSLHEYPGEFFGWWREALSPGNIDELPKSTTSLHSEELDEIIPAIRSSCDFIYQQLFDQKASEDSLLQFKDPVKSVDINSVSYELEKLFPLQHSICHRQFALDCIPTLSTICHSEVHRKATQTKRTRRFLHYLDSISFHLDDDTKDYLISRNLSST